MRIGRAENAQCGGLGSTKGALFSSITCHKELFFVIKKSLFCAVTVQHCMRCCLESYQVSPTLWFHTTHHDAVAAAATRAPAVRRNIAARCARCHSNLGDGE